MTTHSELQTMADFDHVFRVNDDGSIEDVPNVWAPDCHAGDGESDEPILDYPVDTEWEFLTGFTGQYGYNGPVMHSSEFIGGGLADYILSTPGIYCAVIVPGWTDPTPCCRAVVTSGDWGMHEPGCNGNPDTEPAGWAIVRKVK